MPLLVTFGLDFVKGFSRGRYKFHWKERGGGGRGK